MLLRNNTDIEVLGKQRRRISVEEQRPSSPGQRTELERLIQELALFRTIADCAPVMIWISGLDKKCYYFNQPWLQFTGRSQEQERVGFFFFNILNYYYFFNNQPTKKYIKGDGWAEGVHPEDLSRCFNTYVTSFDQQKPFTMRFWKRSCFSFTHEEIN